MILHYLKIATRNVLKYKVQNVICILSIAASAMLLTVVSSVINNFPTPEILDKPYCDRAVKVHLYKSGDWAVWDGTDEITAALMKDLTSVEKIYATGIARPVCEVTCTAGGQQRSLLTETTHLTPGFLNWWGVRSVVTGGDCAELEPGTAILTECTARKLFGRLDVVGETIGVVYHNDYTCEMHNIRVADVVSPSPYDSFNYGSGLFVTSGSAGKETYAAVFMQLREGKTLADLEAEVADKLKDTGYTITAHPVANNYEEVVNIVVPTMRGIIAFLIVFLAVCVIGYMRMQAQLFRIRQREIALRTVVGAKRWQLYAQFSVEVLLILALSLALSLAFNTFMRGYLLENLAFLNDELYMRLDDFVPRTLCSFAVVTALCLATVAFVIRSIRRRQTGLAMMMRPSRHSFASVATMSVQLFFSTFLIAALIIAFCMVRMQMQRCNIPDNDDFYKRCITLQNTAFKGTEPQKQLLELVEKSGNVERIFYLDEAGDFVPIDTVENARQEYASIFFQQEREMLDFSAIEPVITNPHANPAQCVYAPEWLKNRMEQGGTWQRGYIDIKGQRYDIAGYFRQWPYQSVYQHRLIITDANRTANYYSRLVVVARPRRYSAAMQDIQEAYGQAFPGDLSLNACNYRNREAAEIVVFEILGTLFAIVTAISVVTTVASIYSVISLDTRRRRKEMALRKVHGATSRVIRRIFARRYMAICATCYLLLLPALLLFFASIGGPIGIMWWQVWLLTAAVVSLVTALTIGFKIRGVMRVRPADWLKE